MMGAASLRYFCALFQVFQKERMMSYGRKNVQKDMKNRIDTKKRRRYLLDKRQNDKQLREHSVPDITARVIAQHKERYAIDCEFGM